MRQIDLPYLTGISGDPLFLRLLSLLSKGRRIAIVVSNYAFKHDVAQFYTARISNGYFSSNYAPAKILVRAKTIVKVRWQLLFTRSGLACAEHQDQNQ
ncbi:hypothetical protein EAS61_27885 [Bradyrhizobium zhanjiangense]|uniref:Uncharacterized protein n=1 Tax=Bradyrhizobium zhanjiangense TaxID=1325107 RepID=A0A4Q0QF99_9BRAD|nr:hypothetical protein EAS61_27885 [Bradyrhizobium zhanjiangense]